MKKLLTFIMAMLIVSLCFIGVLAETSSISNAEATRIATEAVTKGTDISDEDFAKLIITVARDLEDTNGKTVCNVLFTLPLDYNSESVYSVVIDQKTGEIVTSDIRDTALEDARRHNEGYKVMQEWEKEKGSQYYWSQQDTVDFYNQYFEGGYKMPGEGDLSRNDAIAVAKKYAMESLGLTEEYLNGLPVCANLTTGDEIGGGQSVWYIYFIDESIRSSADGIVSPHMIWVSNPDGKVLGGDVGDTNGVG